MRIGKAVDGLANVSILIIVAFALFTPDGVIRRLHAEWQASREAKKAIERAWVELEATDPRLSGAGGDPELIQFADYQCPFCREAHERLEAFLTRHPDWSVGFRHLPIPDIHAYAEDAAKAAVCADGQGKFLEMHRLLMGVADWEQRPEWSVLAERAGIEEIQTFSECIQMEETTRRVAADVELAKSLGISGTPAWVTKEQILLGALTEERLTELYDSGR